MFVELSGLYRHLWHAYAAWQIAAGCEWDEAGESWDDRAGDRRRWGWLWDWRRAFCAYDAAQSRPDVHRDGQPDLWVDDGANFANEPDRHEDEEHAVWECGCSGESAVARVGGRRDVCCAGLQRGSEASDGADQEGDSAQGIFVS